MPQPCLSRGRAPGGPSCFIIPLINLSHAAAHNLGPTVFHSSIHVESILNGDNTTYSPGHMVDSLWKANKAGGE